MQPAGRRDERGSRSELAQAFSNCPREDRLRRLRPDLEFFEAVRLYLAKLRAEERLDRGLATAADDGRGLGEALRILVNAEYSIVTKELRARQGDAELFAALFTSAETDTVYPLTPDFVSETVNTDITANKMAPVDAHLSLGTAACRIGDTKSREGPAC